ncbi:hypothetical protein [Streptomyces sp. Ru72]|uniref:hypothetical protein n=1 Tax=Streptomyces sp. Ru72 TaxID=2080747 RepID=UPI000CDD8C34|nr:hypothetical protein [Streptomyces sp. Ru72]POX54134.1 hypothetical protein C3488_03485 [Streptomyces sp. Ru72]
MTQSGQGEEPSARPAREGIVLPSDGGAPLLPGQTGGADGSIPPAPASASGPAGGQAWGQPWGPEQAAQQQQQLHQNQQWGAQPSWEGSDPRSAWGQQPHAGSGQPLPPQQSAGAGPLPPAAGSADEGATQFLPPVAASPNEGATQYIPPVAASPDEGATQYIPPVGPGALPPEMPADHATQFLGRATGPLPPAAGPDAQATQYLPPVPGQPHGPVPGQSYAVRPGAPGQAPPAEFDNLFRGGAGGFAEPTQHLPRFDGADAPGAPAGRAVDERGGRTRSRIPLIAAVGVGIVVLGIGAGALLSGGGGSDGKSHDSKSVAATGPAPDASGSGAADPARAQAVALDKLLADSGNSRDAVIRAVANVKACQNLDQSAADLRDAAKQRNDLVSRLSGLQVDKLADHAALTAALTSAWKASASADTHYAAWADQVSDNKGCKKGQARVTGQAAAGNRDSGTASAQKAKAARLWNVIAQKYGLTERQPTQL